MGAVTMYALAVWLAYLCLVTTAVPTPSSSLRRSVQVPNGKVYVYKYSAVVSAGQNEPTPFASKLQIQGKLMHKHYDSDPELKFVEYMKFDGINHTIYNGRDDGEVHGEYQALSDEIKDFEEPILVITDEYNKLQGIKVQEKEAVWSKNMKKSLASIMQMEFMRFEMQETMKPMAFHTTEKTIYGNCQVEYEVYTKEQDGKKLYYVRKVYEPRKCSKYVQSVVSDKKLSYCKIDVEEDLVTSAERIYEFESLNNKDFIVKKITTHEKLSYLPFLHRSYGVQHVETSQIFEFEKVVDESELNLPVIDFKPIKVMNDVTFEKSVYLPDVHFQQEFEVGRRLVKPKDLVREVQHLLLSIANYLSEIHIHVKEADPEYKKALEKLHHTMQYLNTDTMNYILKHFNKDSEIGKLTRKIFLEMVPHTGTLAAWNLTKSVIEREEVSKDIAVNMLARLPMYVLNPTEEFAKKMIGLLSLDSELPKEIQNAGVLCYSILLHKSYKNIGRTKKAVPSFLEERLKAFDHEIRYAPTYLSKLVYIMAMKNVEVGNIYKYLAPIVRGEDVFFVYVDIHKPEKYQIAAMWAVAKSINYDKELTFNLFWPILSNSSNLLPLRVTAYELLVPRNPMLDMNLLMNVHWMMENEKDEHMFNYHYTTIKTMAESKDPCVQSISEMMRKVLRLTKQRKVFSTSLSHASMYDFFDNKYGYGYTLKLGMQIDEASGIPSTGYVDEILSVGRRPNSDFSFYWNIDGVTTNTFIKLIKSLFIHEKLSESKYSLGENVMKVKDVIRKTGGFKLLDDHIHVEFWSMDNGYVTDVQVYFGSSLTQFVKAQAETYVTAATRPHEDDANQNFLDIFFMNHYKMVVATDIGLPAFFYNEAPTMLYMKLEPKITPSSTVTVTLNTEIRAYQHSSYAMKFYNPFADITHAVERRVMYDFILPLDATISFNLETRSLNVVLPRMPETKYSTAGIKLYSIDQVVIESNRTNVLKTHCPTCDQFADIRKGPNHKLNFEDITHSVDTGLEYTYAIFDCDNRVTPVSENEEWLRVLNTERNNAYQSPWAHNMMILQQRISNFMSSPHTSTCGTMLKLSPSSKYPLSEIEMNWRFNAFAVNSELTLDGQGSVEAKGVTYNNTVRSWEINMNGKFSEFDKNLKLQLTRKTPGEKKLKICLKVHKHYPDLMTDSGIVQTNTLIDFTMGKSDDDQCVRDEMVILSVIKGELLDEQVERLKRNVESGTCFKNPFNALDLESTKRFDWNCFTELVQATTMRKYSFDIQYKKIPHEVLAYLASWEDYFHTDNLARITYKPYHTEEGNIKAYVNYSLDNYYANVTVMKPDYSYELKEVPYGLDKDNPYNNVLLDNIGFDSRFLVNYYKGEIRPCIAHANDMINDLNQTVPMKFSDWTLMYGDLSDEDIDYAVFVISIDENKLAVRLAFTLADHLVEIQLQPGSSQPIVTMNGSVIPVAIQSLTNSVRLMPVKDLLVLEIVSKIQIYYTSHNVVIIPHIIADRFIDGMCGHMGSTIYNQSEPLVLEGGASLAP